MKILTTLLILFAGIVLSITIDTTIPNYRAKQNMQIVLLVLIIATILFAIF